MDKIRIRGGAPLNGAIDISGAKNACLTLMPAALLTDAPLTLTNAPRLADIKTMTALLESLGAKATSQDDGRRLELCAPDLSNLTAHYDIVRKMRASILVLGPMLARAGSAQVSLPGGCAIGARPVDLHLSGLEAMGAQMELRDGYVFAKAPMSGLHGARIQFRDVSVGATENLLMAATLAKGETVLENAAREPEIIDLANCLIAMGAEIEGTGTSVIRIQGRESLTGATHQVLTDRIELGTYMIAPAIAGGEVELVGGTRALAASMIEKLEAAGATVTDTPRGLKVARDPGRRLRATDIETAPWPGFATDLQAQFMTLMTLAEGDSQVSETIFENRFMHVPELNRMGADIRTQGSTATVRGVSKLHGAQVMASDLRASASLVLAGLAAEGETVVNRVYHLDRGYERVEEKLSAVGANIKRTS